MSSLIPDGVDGLADLPHTHHTAIVTALHFLDFEELPKEERPPRAIWLNDKKMKRHFKKVEQMRKDRVEGREPDISDVEIEGDVSRNDTEALLGVKR